MSSGACGSLMLRARSFLGGVSLPFNVVPSLQPHTVVIGSVPPEGVLAAVVEPRNLTLDCAYSGVTAAVVRSVLPRRPAGSLQLRDQLDVYPASNINATAEVAEATEAFRSAAKVAISKAKQMSATSITLVLKPASKYKHLNDLFVKTTSAAIEAAGFTADVMHTAKASNDLIMFPEKFGVVLTNDDASSENLQLAYAGALGGVPSTYLTADGKEIFAGHSLKTVALATVSELSVMGLSEEADKLKEVIQSKPVSEW